jgi:hypothetical protein
MCIISFFSGCNNSASVKKDNFISVQQYQHPLNPALIVNDSMSSNYSNYFVDSLVNQLEVALKKVKNPEMTDDVKAVLGKCDYYRTFMKNIFKKATGMQIDYITQFHWTVQLGMDPNQFPPGLLASQTEVRKIIDLSYYNVIGWEMSAIDSLTPESWQLEQENNARMQGYQVTPAEIPLFYKIQSSDSKDDAVLAYWLDNHNAHIMGEQDPVFWYFYDKTAEDPVFTEARKFNSYLALARMIDVMQKHAYKSACIVLGSYHTADLIFLAKRIGIKMKVYDTCHNGTFEESISTLK